MLRRVGVSLLAGFATWATPAAAEPASGPYSTIDQRLTTTQPNAPTGFHFDGRYHAPGDPDGDPPYMRKMAFYNVAGVRWDTSVPERCTASDYELALRGAEACPAGSRLGGGTTTTSFLGGFRSTIDLDFLNNEGEQIIVARSPFVATVARGRIDSDGSVEFASPTCFPSVKPVPCPVDTVLQLGSSIVVPPYTRGSRSYMTSPRKCPAAGHWESPIRMWWADGAVETVVTRQPCNRRGNRRPTRRQRTFGRG